MTDPDIPVAILGAGISGLSTSWHLGHRNCVIFEAKDHYGGHLFSDHRNGFTFDDGPHISFTSNEYVKHHFGEFVDGDFEDMFIKATNYYKGHWIDHPAQTSLWQVPEPLRSRCVESFLDYTSREHEAPKNYEEWLHQAMGPVFADNFPAAYTRKYWTCEPKMLDVDWVGMRVLKPNRDDVVNGAKGPLPKTMYYVNGRSARYPSKGGFYSYLHKLADGADIRYGKRLSRIDFERRELGFDDGTSVTYGQLVTTIPIQVLINSAVSVPDGVKQASETLRSSHWLRLDFEVEHEAPREEVWYYVYDEDKYSVRISVTEHFAPSNAPLGKTGIQVEVYGSAWRPLRESEDVIQRKVLEELLDFGLIRGEEFVSHAERRMVHTGQIIYDLNRRGAIAELDRFFADQPVFRLGRYSEWKYLMTDSCFLGGRRTARLLQGQEDDTDWSGVAITKDDVPEAVSAAGAKA